MVVFPLTSTENKQCQHNTHRHALAQQVVKPHHTLSICSSSVERDNTELGTLVYSKQSLLPSRGR